MSDETRQCRHPLHHPEIANMTPVEIRVLVLGMLADTLENGARAWERDGKPEVAAAIREAARFFETRVAA